MNPDPLYVPEDECPTPWNCHCIALEPTSRAGWLIPLILIAVAVAAVAWRLR